MHPAASWRELVHNTTALYEEARATRLGTDKFMLDGRHTGTGGGNHLVLGGATRERQPASAASRAAAQPARLLDQPSVAVVPVLGAVRRSHQPGAALDEARQDVLYELEIAFACPRPPRRSGAALAGRSPVPSPAGRRDGQHAPHRAVHRQALQPGQRQRPPGPGRAARVRDAARCAHEPGAAAPGARPGRLVLEGAVRAAARALGHDACTTASCSPTSSGRISPTSSATSRAPAFPSTPTGSLPHCEFRFPRYGAVAVDGVELELRQAIEPWHVLGEEPGGGGTARYVDSSVERLQVLVRGLTDGRHQVACNGQPLPLHPTGRAGEHVAGVRYRRGSRRRRCTRPWPSHAPLTFDLIDTLVGARHRRLHLPRCAPRRACVRRLSEKWAGSRKPPHRPFRPVRPFARRRGAARRGAQPRASAHARPATPDLRRRPFRYDAGAAMSTLSSGGPKPGLVRGYAPRAGSFDEMMDAEAHVRPVWRKLLQQLEALDESDLGRRWDKARHLIHENGVSYNVYGDPRGLERPWNLSLIPVRPRPRRLGAAGPRPLAAGAPARRAARRSLRPAARARRGLDSARAGVRQSLTICVRCTACSRRRRSGCR